MSYYANTSSWTKFIITHRTAGLDVINDDNEMCSDQLRVSPACNKMAQLNINKTEQFQLTNQIIKSPQILRFWDVQSSRSGFMNVLPWSGIIQVPSHSLIVLWYFYSDAQKLSSSSSQVAFWLTISYQGNSKNLSEKIFCLCFRTSQSVNATFSHLSRICLIK